jgi:hypothetical protein
MKAQGRALWKLFGSPIKFSMQSIAPGNRAQMLKGEAERGRL